jgi:hypothetical protein
MQDGHYFATLPRLIGNRQPAAMDGPQPGPPQEHASARRGQVARIGAQPVDHAPSPPPIFALPVADQLGPAGIVVAAPAEAPMVLRAEDRVAPAASFPVAQATTENLAIHADPLPAALARFALQQDDALSRIAQACQNGLARLEGQVAAALAESSATAARIERLKLDLATSARHQTEGLHGLVKALSALSGKIDTVPEHSDRISQDISALPTEALAS